MSKLSRDRVTLVMCTVFAIVRRKIKPSKAVVRMKIASIASDYRISPPYVSKLIEGDTPHFLISFQNTEHLK